MKQNLILFFILLLFIISCKEKDYSYPNLLYALEEISIIQSNNIYLIQDDSILQPLIEVEDLIKNQELFFFKSDYNLSLNYSKDDLIFNSLKILSLIKSYSINKDTINFVEKKLELEREFNLYNFNNKNDIIILLINIRIIFNYLLQDYSRFILLKAPTNMSPTLTIFGYQQNTSYIGNIFLGFNLKNNLLLLKSNKTNVNIIDSSNYWILEYNKNTDSIIGEAKIKFPNEILKNIKFKIE